MTPAVPDELFIGTWNLWEHGMYPGRAGESERYARQLRVAGRKFPCHVWMFQEFGNVEAFAKLADALGMEYMAATPGEITGEPVFDPGGRGFGVGVMWSPEAGITPVAGTRRVFTHDVFFHGVASVVLNLREDRLLHVASSHATPWGAPQNIAEAKRWVSIMTRPNRGLPSELAGRVLPGVLGTDSNGITGDRIQREDGTWQYHAPDPLEGRTWTPDMIYRTSYPYHRLDPRTGLPIPESDRTAGDILWAGGLFDSTAVLGLNVTPTTGFHPTDPFPWTDLDHLRLNQTARNAVTGVEVLDDDEDVHESSDHRPKRITLRRSLIPRQLTNSATR